MKTWILPLVLAFCPLPVSAAQKAEQQNRHFRVTSKTVLVDLVARDNSGASVNDLKKSEIEVYQDGRRQKMTHFERLTSQNAGSLVGGASAEGFVIPKVEDPMAFAGPVRTPRVVILLDLGNIEPEVMVRVKSHLAKFLTGTKMDRTQFLLLTLDKGLHVNHGWTSDRSEVLRAVEGLRASLDARTSYAVFSSFAVKLEQLFNGASRSYNPMGLAANMGASFISGLRTRMKDMSESMGALFRYLRHYRGRKHLVFYSSGYPLHPERVVRTLIEERVFSGATSGLAGGYSDPALIAIRKNQNGAGNVLAKEIMNAVLSHSVQDDFSHYFAQIVDQANRSQVAIYSVDVRGLMTGPFSGKAANAGLSKAFSGAYLAKLRQSMIWIPQEFLIDLSARTAAQPFVNSNDLKKGLGVAVQDARNYYLIAYTPEGKQEDGKFHKIEVRLKRKGVSYLYRQGYLDLDNATVASQDILSAVRYPDLFQDYKIDFQTARQAGKLKVTALIPARELRFRKEGKNFTGSLELFAVLLDSDGRWVGKNVLFSRGQHLQFTPERREQLKNIANVSLSNEVNMPKAGTYTLVLVVRQQADDSIVAVRHPLKIS